MKILCLGDSNTYGYDPRSYLGGRYPMAWPEKMHEMKGWETVNLGENGREIPHIEAVIQAVDRQIENLQPADLMIILLGSNDMINIRHVTAENVAGRMDRYISHIRGKFPRLDIFLLVPVQITLLGEEISRAFGHLSAAYKKIAGKYGLGFADTNDFGIPVSFDGVHFTKEGHQLLAAHLVELLS